jgi:hypothetical protein
MVCWIDVCVVVVFWCFGVFAWADSSFFVSRESFFFFFSLPCDSSVLSYY